MFPELYWPDVRKKLFWPRKTFEIHRWSPKIFKIFEVTRTIYWNSKRLKTIFEHKNCFFNLFNCCFLNVLKLFINDFLIMWSNNKNSLLWDQTIRISLLLYHIIRKSLINMFRKQKETIYRIPSGAGMTPLDFLI